MKISIAGFTLFFVFTANLLFAQDIIVLKDAKEIEAKVLEVSPTEVKYKMTSNPDGPVYTIDKSTVFFIKYQNGYKEVMNTPTPNTPAPTAPEPSPTNPPSNSNAYPAQKSSNTYDIPTKRSYFSISPLGVAIPLGNYASTSISNEKSGYALGGWNGNVEVFGFLAPGFGLGGQFSIISNGFDKETYDRQFIQTLQSQAPGVTFSNFTSTYPNHTVLNITPGLIGSFQWGRSSIDFKTLAGLLLYFHPALEVSLRSGNTVYNSKILPNVNPHWVIVTGINYRYYFTNQLGLKISLDYQYSYNIPTKLTVNSSVQSTSGGFLSNSTTQTLQTDIVNILFSAGIFVGLSK